MKHIGDIAEEALKTSVSAEAGKLVARDQKLDLIIREIETIQQTQIRFSGEEWNRQWRLNQEREALCALLKQANRALRALQRIHSTERYVESNPSAVAEVARQRETFADAITDMLGLVPQAMFFVKDINEGGPVLEEFVSFWGSDHTGHQATERLSKAVSHTIAFARREFGLSDQAGQ